ncbi:MAG TPA: phosphoglycerate kinase [Phycisphaerae bacterium]|nr:phosphoglycerate kinase [Phycisphaerae bacterium]HRR85065.1 phosphoglycerate kinase [Phycisphaerae bacterium]
MPVDFNVPQDDAGNIADDRRIRMAMPTMQHVITNGGQGGADEPLGPA